MRALSRFRNRPVRSENRLGRAWRIVPCYLAIVPALSYASDRADWQERMQPITPRSYLCQRATTPPVIDGKIEEAAWAGAPWTAEFVDIQGQAKPKPRWRTRAKQLWDDKFLYIAAELEEPHLWATLTNHDAVIFQDPDFEVFIDP